MFFEQKINCPDCDAQVSFDLYKMIAGAPFRCPNCLTAISLAPESIAMAEEARTAFDRLKASMKLNTGQTPGDAP